MHFDTVLDFWFGELVDAMPDAAHQKNWFAADETFDVAVKKKFTMTLLAGSRGELDAWELTPHGRLAFVLVLDQFPRHIFRGTANAFLYDEKALSLARDGVEFGHNQPLKSFEKVFLYMPYQHSESLRIQEEGVELYRQLLANVGSTAEKELCERSYKMAMQHHKIIEKFGRFPHRNKVLGRVSTKIEEEFLNRYGQRFGQ